MLGSFWSCSWIYRKYSKLTFGTGSFRHQESKIKEPNIFSFYILHTHGICSLGIHAWLYEFSHSKKLFILMIGCATVEFFYNIVLGETALHIFINFNKPIGYLS